MDSIECPDCKHQGTPHLWHYQPFFLGKIRYQKTQHQCRICGSVMYESGGQITGFGWLCLIALAYLLGVYFLQRAFPGLGLNLGNVFNPIINIFIFGLLFLSVRKLIQFLRRNNRKPPPKH
ncbi:hypothetical protein ACO0LF_30755 [Undibacterium sp. Di27W]|uniref:hypothetical protein n=1 Tax=Undibacterium sp. Di27W TaxID=3413036 RepID=UPI003BF3F046